MRTNQVYIFAGGLNLVSLLLLFSPTAGRCAGLLRPTDGSAPLSIENQRVLVDISDGITVTEVFQEFRNDSPEPLEAVYSFPLPPDAGLSGFSMWINGEEIEGEVVERERARGIYDELVHPVAPMAESLNGGSGFGQGFKDGRSKVLDPGLVEEVSYREFRATVFPVPARGTQRVRLTYYQHLRTERDRVTYIYPLETRADEHSRAGGGLEMEVRLRSSVPLRHYGFPGTPEEEITVEVPDSRTLSAWIRRPSGDLDQDIVFTYQLGREAPGLDLVTYRAPGEDGYFLLLASAPVETSAGPVPAKPTDYTFVVDVSGSMRLERRLNIAAEAILRFLESSGPEDRFNVIVFNVQPEALASSFLRNTRPARQEMRTFLRKFQGIGGSDLYPALELAYSMSAPERRHAVVVMTDGGLNDLDVEHRRFLDLVSDRPDRIFGIALGNDANLPLLRALAEETGGFFAWISSREDLARRGDQLRDRMRLSPWRDLSLTSLGGAGVRSLGPALIPDLYPGTQVAVFGRYASAGSVTFQLRGARDGKPAMLELEAELPETDRRNPEIRRMWAEARIDDLLQDSRAGRLDAKARGEIVALGTEHSIVSPYTSFLVLESEQMFRDYGIERRSHALLEEERTAREERARAHEEEAAHRVNDLGETTPSRGGPSLPGLDAGALDGSLLLLAAGLYALRRASTRRRRGRDS